jgi:hypothetical protein
MNHPITPLASGQVNHDHLSVELVEPDGMPAVVRIVWPTAPTITTPAATTKWPAQPCAYSLRRPRPWPESKQANGINPAQFTGRPFPPPGLAIGRDGQLVRVRAPVVSGKSGRPSSLSGRT